MARRCRQLLDVEAQSTAASRRLGVSRVAWGAGRRGRPRRPPSIRGWPVEETRTGSTTSGARLRRRRPGSPQPRRSSGRASMPVLTACTSKSARTVSTWADDHLGLRALQIGRHRHSVFWAVTAVSATVPSAALVGGEGPQVGLDASTTAGVGAGDGHRHRGDHEREPTDRRCGGSGVERALGFEGWTRAWSSPVDASRRG